MFPVIGTILYVVSNYHTYSVLRLLWGLSMYTIQMLLHIGAGVNSACRICTKVLSAATSELGISSSHFVCAVRTAKADQKHFLLPNKSHAKCLCLASYPGSSHAWVRGYLYSLVPRLPVFLHGEEPGYKAIYACLRHMFHL